MSQTPSQRLFIELNDHSVVAARTTARDASVFVEDLQEHLLAAKAPVAAAISALVAASGASAATTTCVLRPGRRFFHLASADEVRQYATAAAIREFAAGPLFAEFGASRLASVSARTGAQPGDGKTPWLVAGVPDEKTSAATTLLQEWQLAPARYESATLSLLGAAHQLLRAPQPTGPLLVWEIAENSSDLFVVSADGVEATRRVGFGFDKIIEALLAEITLKFKASAAKLFFNELYDFSEAGPKIAARVAEALKADVAAVGSQARRAPTHFVADGLPAKQAWFNQNLTSAIHLTAWQPDLAAWSAKAGFGFAPALLEAGVSPAWLGLLGSVGAGSSNKPVSDAPWHPVWFGDALANAQPAVLEKPAAPATASAPAPVPAATPPPTVAAKKLPVPAVVVSTSAPTQVAKPSPVPAASARVAAPAPAAKASAPESSSNKNNRNDGGNGKERGDAQSGKFPRGSTPAPSAKTPGPAPAAAAPAKPAESVVEFPRAARKPSFLQNRVAVVLAGVVVLVLGFGVFYLRQTAVEKAAAVREREQFAKQAAGDAEARRRAEAKAEEAAEARRVAEEAAAKTASLAQAERQRADEEARRREIETKRLMNARGALLIVTDPVGATIEIGNLSPRVSPATISDLRLGRYTAVVSLSGFDPVTVDLEVKENETTNQGTIILTRQFGKLTVSSDPAGVNFEVRPAGAHAGVGASHTQWGTTPATVEDLPVGDYSVTLVREGWPSRTETVSVQKGAVAQVTRNYAGGSVNLSSRPQGASVFANGANLGVTPLVLRDLPPGDVTFTLELSGHLPAKTSGQVSADKPLDLSIALDAVDRLAGLSELDERPVPVKTVNPMVDPASFTERQSVIISVIVDTDGTPRDLQVVQSTNDVLASSCLDAVTEWRFKPAIIKGKPVKTRVSIPFVVK